MVAIERIKSMVGPLLSMLSSNKEEAAMNNEEVHSNNKETQINKESKMKFKVVSPNTEISQEESTANPQEQIKSLVSSSPVFLFMKGTPEAPQCGFSAKVCEILGSWKIPFKSFNIFTDEGIRQGVKEFANWPTIPQLYINQEFIGGCDIIEELSQTGEMAELLKKAYPDQEFASPAPPADVKNVSPSETAEFLKNTPDAHLLDVRTLEEWNIVHIEGSKLVDQDLVDEILSSWAPETPLFVLCHHGQRSVQASHFFTSKGFQVVHNVVGGIEEWAQSTDPSLARY